MAPAALAVIRSQFTDKHAASVFIDDSPTSAKVNGHKVVTLADFCSWLHDEHLVAMAIADTQAAEKLDIVAVELLLPDLVSAQRMCF